MQSGVSPVHDPAAFLQRWHYLGLFAVIFAEEAGIPLPIPGDLFIAAMGFLACTGRASFVPAAAVVTIATVGGATLLFLLSRHAGRRLLGWAGRWLGYDAAGQARQEARAAAWLRRRGFLAVVVGRLIPGLRIVMTIVAGALRVPHPTFVVGTAVAGLVWATLYFWIGYALGAGYRRLAGPSFAPPWPALAGAALLVIAAAVAVRLRVRARASREHRPPAPPA